MRAFLARAREARLEQVVRAQRDEPVGLHPPAAAQHPLDRRAEIVVSDQRRTPRRRTPTPRRAPPGTPAGSRACAPARSTPPRSKRASGTGAPSSPRRRSPPSPRPSRPPPPPPAPCTTARTPRRPARPARGGARAHTGGPAARTPRRRARPAAARGSAWRCAAACAAPTDQRSATNRSARDTRPASAPAAPPAACAPAAAATPTPAGPSVDAPRAVRANACDRQPLELPVSADLLEQLHSRSHPFRDLPSMLDRARTVDSPSDGSGAKSSVRTGAKSGVRAQVRAVAPRAGSEAVSTRRERVYERPHSQPHNALRLDTRPRGASDEWGQVRPQLWCS